MSRPARAIPRINVLARFEPDALAALDAWPVNLDRTAKLDLLIRSNLMKYIENDGALYRGPARGVPLEVWSARQKKFIPYALKDQPRGVEWGEIIDDAAAQEIMAQPFGG